eukprot:TRINITY_DN12411_c0_g1_i1.p2 TRINITY_DN12411_c0_g1~~TRINITY_DN12411_c0_g1_i1.p2  ORF type:complete len:103 (-),score=20.07 TRINITY_DN12411_c0_g1_i1:234-542(-)
MEEAVQRNDRKMSKGVSQHEKKLRGIESMNRPRNRFNEKGDSKGCAQQVGCSPILRSLQRACKFSFRKTSLNEPSHIFDKATTDSIKQPKGLENKETGKKTS